MGKHSKAAHKKNKKSAIYLKGLFFASTVILILILFMLNDRCTLDFRTIYNPESAAITLINLSGTNITDVTADVIINTKDSGEIVIDSIGIRMSENMGVANIEESLKNFPKQGIKDVKLSPTDIICRHKRILFPFICIFGGIFIFSLIGLTLHNFKVYPL